MAKINFGRVLIFDWPTLHLCHSNCFLHLCIYVYCPYIYIYGRLLTNSIICSHDLSLTFVAFWSISTYLQKKKIRSWLFFIILHSYILQEKGFCQFVISLQHLIPALWMFCVNLTRGDSWEEMLAPVCPRKFTPILRKFQGVFL